VASSKKTPPEFSGSRQFEEWILAWGLLGFSVTEELTDEAIRKPFAGDPGHMKTRLGLLTDKHCLSNVEASINRSIPTVPNCQKVRSATPVPEAGVEN
jgi:hypothetical protein